LIFDLVLRGGKVVFPLEGVVNADLGIKDGKIVSISKTISRSAGSRVVDLAGKTVMPGVVDAHSHFGIYQPLANDAASESRAAVTGGITTVLNIIRPRPYYLNMRGSLEELLKALLKTSKTSFIPDYGYTLAPVERAHLQEIEKLAMEGVPTFKFFMHYRNFQFSEEPYDGGFLYDLMKSIAKANAKHGGMSLSVHCEDPELIRVSGQTGIGIKESNDRGAVNPSDDAKSALQAYYDARPPEVEAMAVGRAIQMAYYTKCPINILHITSALAMDAAVRLPRALGGVDITREVVIHHLVLTTASKEGVFAKVNPPIRHEEDVEAMWKAIQDGSVDVVASDHAAAPLKMKQGGVWKAIFGFGGNTLLLPLMLSEGYHRRDVPLTRIAQLVSYNPARIYGLSPRKGRIEIGQDADLAVVDLEKEQKVTPELLNSSQEYTPFEGYRVKGWPWMTIRRGEIVFENGRVTGKPGRGRFIRRPVSNFEKVRS